MSQSKKLKPKLTKEQEYKAALLKIAKLGSNIKEDAKDYKNIALIAIHAARDAVAGKCKECGKAKEFIP